MTKIETRSFHTRLILVDHSVTVKNSIKSNQRAPVVFPAVEVLPGLGSSNEAIPRC